MAEKLNNNEADRVASHAVKFLRELRGMSREQLAERLTEVTGDDWSSSMITNLETERKTISVSTLKALCEVLDSDPSFFMYGPGSLTDRTAHARPRYRKQGGRSRSLIPHMGRPVPTS